MARTEASHNRTLWVPLMAAVFVLGGGIGQARPVKALPDPVDSVEEITMPEFVKVLTIVKKKDGTEERHVHKVPFITYVIGTLGPEYYGRYHKETLMAGAVAIKQWLIFNTQVKNKHRSPDFDVYNGENDQVYSYETFCENTGTATAKTEGYRDKFINAVRDTLNLWVVKAGKEVDKKKMELVHTQYAASRDVKVAAGRLIQGESDLLASTRKYTHQRILEYYYRGSQVVQHPPPGSSILRDKIDEHPQCPSPSGVEVTILPPEDKKKAKPKAGKGQPSGGGNSQNQGPTTPRPKKTAK